jgi:outer membrane lipoprotein-sorting protein
MNEPTESGHRDEADNVQRALAAVSRQADGQEASDQILAGTLAKMRQTADAGTTSTKTFLLWITTMTFTQKIAAAFMLTVGGLILWFVFSLFGGFAGVTYAEVAQQIRSLRTVSWTETISGPTTPLVTMKVMCMEPGRLRMEYLGGNAMIMDKDQGKSLVLNTAAKTAQIMQFQTGGQPMPMQEMEDYFLKLADQQGQPIADRQIGGITAKGFKADMFGFPVSLWVDPKTKLPLVVETTVTMLGRQMNVVMKDFVFDAPMEESLFSVEPPAGYKVSGTQPMILVMDVEQNVKTLLGYYSAHSDGKFPASLTDLSDVSKMVAGGMKDGRIDDDSQKVLSAAGALMGTLFSMKQGIDYDYTPQGVKFGDADKRILWYRKRDTQTYRAMYGDLHAADINLLDLPAAVRASAKEVEQSTPAPPPLIVTPRAN